jgi:hypothetical protein
VIKPLVRGDVCCVGYRFGRKCSNVGMVARIEDEIALASLGDEPQLSELSKVLGDCGRGRADVLSEIVDRVLSMKQRPEDTEPSFDRYGLQQCNR